MLLRESQAIAISMHWSRSQWRQARRPSATIR